MSIDIPALVSVNGSFPQICVRTLSFILCIRRSIFATCPPAPVVSNTTVKTVTHVFFASSYVFVLIFKYFAAGDYEVESIAKKRAFDLFPTDLDVLTASLRISHRQS